jgi:hypothetical protein
VYAGSCGSSDDGPDRAVAARAGHPGIQPHPEHSQHRLIRAGAGSSERDRGAPALAPLEPGPQQRRPVRRQQLDVQPYDCAIRIHQPGHERRPGCRPDRDPGMRSQRQRIAVTQSGREHPAEKARAIVRRDRQSLLPQRRARDLRRQHSPVCLEIAGGIVEVRDARQRVEQRHPPPLVKPSGYGFGTGGRAATVQFQVRVPDQHDVPASRQRDPAEVADVRRRQGPQLGMQQARRQRVLDPLADQHPLAQTGAQRLPQGPPGRSRRERDDAPTFGAVGNLWAVQPRLDVSAPLRTERGAVDGADRRLGGQRHHRRQHRRPAAGGRVAQHGRERATAPGQIEAGRRVWRCRPAFRILGPAGCEVLLPLGVLFPPGCRLRGPPLDLVRLPATLAGQLLGPAAGAGEVAAFGLEHDVEQVAAAPAGEVEHPALFAPGEFDQQPIAIWRGPLQSVAVACRLPQ